MNRARATAMDEPQGFKPGLRKPTLRLGPTAAGRYHAAADLPRRHA